MQINIWSHLLPCLLCAYWLVRCLQAHPVWNEPHYAVVAGSLVCGSFCFGASVCYHLLMPTTPDSAAYRRLMMVDLAGIWFVNLVRRQWARSCGLKLSDAGPWFYVCQVCNPGPLRHVRNFNFRAVLHSIGDRRLYR
jgi:hypothetical protein